MGGITLGTGIFSGIDTRTLIDQLISIEARPRVLAQQRIIVLNSQQAAYIDLNSTLLALKTAAAKFNDLDVFTAKTASSSDTDVLNATASKFASPGLYNLQIESLVTTAQTISKGFADSDISSLGATQFSFEVGGGRVDSETLLSELNGAAGIDRGTFLLTDSAGVTATIDLSKAITVNDVLDAINSNGAIGVTASLDDDHFVLTDTAGGAGTLSVSETFGSTTAASLGIAGSATGVTLTGTDVYSLSADTPLSLLRDNLGVQFGEGGRAAPADFKITVQDAGGGNATPYNITLGSLGFVQDEGLETEEYITTDGSVVTIGDLFDRIDSQTSSKVAGSISADGTSIVLTAVDGGRELFVEDSNNRTTATDLGITGTTAAALTSQRLFGGLNTVLLSRLNGGTGITAGTFDVTQRDGTLFSVTVGAGDTLDDVLAQLNANAGITASVSSTGNGITITDSTTGGNLIIADTSGTAAADLGIVEAGASTGIVDSGNQQVQWLSNATRLESLNGGKGIGTGDFTITDSSGANATVTIDSTLRNLNDVIEKINNKSSIITVTASLNSQGDGIVLTDTGSGSSALKVEDTSGTVARKLNLKGEAEWSAGDPPADNILDGSYERVVTLDAADTLQDISDKINNAGVGVDAAVIGVGGGPTPFRLVFTSESTGAVGSFNVDTSGFDIGQEELTKGQDAVAFFGSNNPADALLVTSSTNTLDRLITGVTIDLRATSDTPVEVTVIQNTTVIEETIEEFIESYNTVIDRMNAHTAFDEETRARGALFGDISLQNIRSSLQRTVQSKPLNAPGQFEFLFQIGIRIGTGGKLEFDRDDFREAYEQDPQAVEDLLAAFEQEAKSDKILDENGVEIPGVTVTAGGFDKTSLGVMELVEQIVETFTDSIDGLLTNRRATLDIQIRSQEGRIEGINSQLAVKRGKLEREFLAMEQIIASLQTQSQALNSLSLFG